VTQGVGCISQDPNLSGGWRLLSPSPCIETANPALDVGDGTIADMGAWQWGTAVSAPVGFFNAGWNWFSIPLPPHNAGASAVLGFDATNILYRWNPDTKNTELYPDDFTLLEVKRGYVLRLGGPVDVTYQAVGYTTPQTIPIRYQGITMIGLPGWVDVALDDLTIRNLVTDEVRTAMEDYAKPEGSQWMNWNWVYWDSSDRQPKVCSLAGGDDDTMRLWFGYRVWTNVDDLELVLPQGKMGGPQAPSIPTPVIRNLKTTPPRVR
jgi:hypothetical protein